MIKSITILTILIVLSSLIFPWWIIVVVSFIFMLFSKQKSLLRSLSIGFLSGVIAYLIYSLYSSMELERSPAELLANLLGALPSWSSYIITALVGGIAAAFGTVSGYLAKKCLK